MRGGRNPRVVLSICNWAEAFGVAVPMPTLPEDLITNALEDPMLDVCAPPKPISQFEFDITIGSF